MQERRNYFRIDDTALLKYRVIQAQVLEHERQRLFLDYVRREDARKVLLGIDVRFTELLMELKKEAPETAEICELLNRKLSLIERLINLTDPDSPVADYPEHDLREINLSGSGVAIVANAPLAVGAHIEIDLLLLPNYQHVKAFARVIDCRSLDDGSGHVIATEFEHIRDEDRETVVQHVMRKQSVILKARRDGAAPQAVGVDGLANNAAKP